MACEYIYLVHPAFSIAKNEPVYKIGRTNRINYARFKEYPSGSILLLQTTCNNSRVMENIILERFKWLFVHRSDYGREYFQGDYRTMIRTINEECVKEKDTVEKVEIDNNANVSDLSDEETVQPNNEDTKKRKGVKYSCEACDYRTKKKGNYTSHCATKKHLELIKRNATDADNKNYVCSNCKKRYKSRVGLWQHGKKCRKETTEPEQITEPEQPDEPVAQVIYTSLLLNIAKDNPELKAMILEQSKQLMEILSNLKMRGELTNTLTENK